MATTDDLIVIKFLESSRFFPDRGNWVYNVVRANLRYDGVWVPQYKEISKEEAKKIIEKRGLKLAVSNKHGKIWDTEDESFRGKYEGLIKGL